MALTQSRHIEQDAANLAAARPQEQPRTDPMPLFTGGIHTEKAPNELELNELVACSGLHIVAGKLVVDTGYVPFSHDYMGEAQMVRQLLYSNSTQTTILITTFFVYTYDPAVAQWKFPSSASLRHVVGDYPAGSTVLELDDISGISVGTWVGVDMPDGTQFIAIVTNIDVPGSTITIAPLPQAIVDNDVVNVSFQLSGDPSLSQCVGVLFPGNEWFIFCNGRNQIAYYFEGVVTALPGFAVTTTCRAMEVFHSMLFIGNLVEGGDALPSRVRQSNVGDPTGWDPGVDGIAAIYDLLDTPDEVLNLNTLGPWIMAYRADTIMRGSFIGAVNEIIFWEYMSQADGILSQGAVADVGSSHIIVGTDNVYEYKGGYDLPPIGEPIYQNFLARDGDFYAPAQVTLFCTYVPALREVWILYPSTQVAPEPNVPDFPNKMLRYNIALRCWQERVFADEFLCSGTYIPQEIITWATAPGQWDDTIWARPWASRSNLANVPNVFLGPATGTQLFMYDFAATTDNGVVIPWQIVTREYGDVNEYRRWQRIQLLGIGDATVERSQNAGVSWLPVGLAQMRTNRESGVDLWPEVSSTRFQLRLSGDDHDFELRYGRIDSEFESDW